jgi:hypothetical protein
MIQTQGIIGFLCTTIHGALYSGLKTDTERMRTSPCDAPYFSWGAKEYKVDREQKLSQQWFMSESVPGKRPTGDGTKCCGC